MKKLVRVRDVVCVWCGMTDPQSIAETGRRLHVHRRVPPLGYTPDNCALVCRRCHAIAHGQSEPVSRVPIRPLRGPSPVVSFRFKKVAIAKLDALAAKFAAESGRPENRTTVILQLISREYQRRTKKEGGG